MGHTIYPVFIMFSQEYTIYSLQWHYSLFVYPNVFVLKGSCYGLFSTARYVECRYCDVIMCHFNVNLLHISVPEVHSHQRIQFSSGYSYCSIEQIFGPLSRGKLIEVVACNVMPFMGKQLFV